MYIVHGTHTWRVVTDHLGSPRLVVDVDTGAVRVFAGHGGAVEALAPERLILLPDGVEDLWNDGYRDLVSLA